MCNSFCVILKVVYAANRDEVDFGLVRAVQSVAFRSLADAAVPVGMEPAPVALMSRFFLVHRMSGQ